MVTGWQARRDGPKSSDVDRAAGSGPGGGGGGASADRVAGRWRAPRGLSAPVRRRVAAAAGNGVIDETGQTSARTGRDRSLADAANTHSAAAVSGETRAPRLFAATERPRPRRSAPSPTRREPRTTDPVRTAYDRPGFEPRSAAFEPRPPVMVVYRPHGRCTPAARPGASIVVAP